MYDTSYLNKQLLGVGNFFRSDASFSRESILNTNTVCMLVRLELMLARFNIGK